MHVSSHVTMEDLTVHSCGTIHQNPVVFGGVVYSMHVLCEGFAVDTCPTICNSMTPEPHFQGVACMPFQHVPEVTLYVTAQAACMRVCAGHRLASGMECVVGRPRTPDSGAFSFGP